MPGALAPFRSRAFAAVWSGAFVSNIGTWMETVVIGYVVADTTGRAAWAGVVAAAGFAPSALLAPFGGVLADRFPRRTVVVVGALVQAALAGVLALMVAGATPPPGPVALVVLAAGCTSALTFPAYQSLLPSLVERELVLAATALSQAQWNLGRVLGPVAAGIMIEVAGYSAALAFNAASFLAIVAAMAAVRIQPNPPVRQSVFAALASGARFARTDVTTRAALVCLALVGVLASPFIGLIPAVVTEVFDAGSSATAALTAAQGAGAVAAAVVTAPLAARFGRTAVLRTGLVALPAVLAGYALAPTLVAAAVGLALLGACYLAVFSGLGAMLQLRAPEALRGRVMSLFMMTLGAAYPVGLLVQGSVADVVGLRMTTTACAVLLAMAFVVAGVTRPALVRALAVDAGVQASSAG